MKTLSNISRKLTASLCAILLAAFTMPCSAADYNRDLSVEKLKECKLMVINSHLLIKNWVYIEKNPDTPDKLALKKLHNEDFPKLQAEMMELAKKWDESDYYELESIFVDINDLLFDYQKGIMRTLNSKANYDDDIIVMEAQEMVEQDEISATNDVIARIDMLIERITAADISQTVQPLFPNLSNLKGNSYTYETIEEQGASYEEAEKAVAMKIRRLHAKQLSLPIDSISVEKLTPTTEILKNNVYEVFKIVENKDANTNGVASHTTRITKVYLVPKKNFTK
ncbi:MAG: hypothetical protein IKW86_05605 [Salinivirgaceae bacterium]|nr:hypothetical protein [Salinivirgaceae bacterium]